MGGAVAPIVKPVVKAAEKVGVIDRPEAPAAAKAEGTTAKAAAAAPAAGLGAAVQQTVMDNAKRRRGRAATILTGYEGVGAAQVGTKTLLGG